MSEEVDLQKLQEQYELAGKLLGRLGGDLDEAKNRLSEIAEIRRSTPAGTQRPTSMMGQT